MYLCVVGTLNFFPLPINVELNNLYSICVNKH